VGKKNHKPAHQKPKKSNSLGFIWAIFKHNWPVGILIAFPILLAYLNFDSNTFLTGWDNLHPEFNLNLDFQRNFFGVWQEYRSTGLLAGQAHAADLPRLLIIYLLNLLGSPINYIRYLTTFIPLFVGPVAVYFLIQEILHDSNQTGKVIKTGAFLAGIYYILNLSTLQTFFIPFETFTWFYGALPLILLFYLKYLKHPSLGKLLLVLFVSFFSGTAFYVETIFIVLFLCLIPFAVDFLVTSKKKFGSLKNILLSITTIILPQLYWLSPVIFYVKTNALFTTQNRINLISSPETYFRNLEFGNLQNVFLLKSYLFKFLDLGSNGKYDYLLNIWRNHLNYSLISLIGYAIFVIIAMGVYFSFKEKFAWNKSFLSILVICLFFLLGGGLLINNSIPLVGELFRSPFTKFSIPLSLTFSYFFAIGVIFLLDIFSFLDTRLTYNFTLYSVVIALVVYMSPAFSGNFISKSMRVAIPNEYFELFNYLDTQPKESRIANFPQNTFWGWNYYSWGYRGSGFIWYGIKQPILDRAFDVWEKTSQDYYEELSSALFSQNKSDFDKVINKYNVTYLLVDNSIIAPDTKASLGLDYLHSILKDNPNYELEKSFGDNIILYKNLSQKSQNFISVNSLSDIRELQPKADPLLAETSGILNFPLRPNTNWYSKAGFLNTNINIPCNLTSEICNLRSLVLPSLSKSENLLPYKIEYKKVASNLSIRLTPITPTFFLNKNQIDLNIKPQTLNIPINEFNKNYILSINSENIPFELPSEIKDFSNYYPLKEIYLPTQKSFEFNLYNGIPTEQLPLINSLANAIPTQCYYEPKTPSKDRKIEKILSPRSVTLLGTDVVGCLSTALPSINSSQLVAISFVYYSPTLTTANINITNNKFGTETTSQPLDPSNTPKFAQIFTKANINNKQLNLILEASETKSIQEVTYKDVYFSTHDSLFEASVVLNSIPEKKIKLSDTENNLQISIPNTKTQFDINQISSSNALFPENRNCDQFNKGETVKIVNTNNILYQSRDALECDYLNLRHFSHSLNYLIGLDVKNNKGLPLTTCLENHTTRRCDVHERLTNTNSTQYLLQPISNSLESNGYTLHIFNQSLGNRITENQLNSITIQPFPLTFLKSITISDNQNKSDTRELSSDISSSHPAEFLYTAVIARSDSDVAIPDNLNLYQTSSPYWKAFILPESYKNLNPWQLTLKILLNYKSLPQLEKINNDEWFNSWSLSPNCNLKSEICNLVVIYLPQYLEFFGFIILILFSLGLFITTFIKQLQPRKKQ
jgi:hypothetical protein